jgi:hypothetical protein
LSQNSFGEITHWAQWGDTRGYLEPCGCDENTNFGGLLRNLNYLEKIKDSPVKTYIFSTGNITSKSLSQPLLEAIGKSIYRSNTQAILLTPTDLPLYKIHKDLPWVLTNKKKTLKIEQNLQIDKKVTVFGIVDPIFFPDETDLNLNISEYISKNQKTEYSVLLYLGSKKFLLNLLKKTSFDLILCANDTSLDHPIDGNERLFPLTLEFNDTPYLLKIPMGGSALLLSHELSDYLNPDFFIPDKKDAEEGAFFEKKLTATHKFHWLAEDRVPTSYSTEPILAQQKKDHLNYLHETELMVFHPDRSEFVGAESCQTCHITQYNTWKNSSHSRAFATLENKNKSQNQDCVMCHVTGHKNNGFISKEKTPHLVNVQCENCHGPRKNHIKNSTIKGIKPDTQLCKTCHHPPHSTKFEFEKYWEKIKH